MGTIGGISDPACSEPIVWAWNQKVKQADAFIIITPEYNHSIPGGLKNPTGSVGSHPDSRTSPSRPPATAAASAGNTRDRASRAGARRSRSRPLRNTVVIPSAGVAFDGQGEPANPATSVNPQVMPYDLAW